MIKVTRIFWHSAKEERPTVSGKYLVITNCGSLTDLYYLDDPDGGWNCTKQRDGSISNRFSMNDSVVAWSDCLNRMALIRDEIEATYGN